VGRHAELKGPPEDLPDHHTHFCWDELHTRDTEKFKGFYGEVFGWTYDGMDMGPMGTYWIARRGEKGAAGVMTAPPKAVPQWLPAVFRGRRGCADQEGQGAGGKVWVEPVDIPGIGRFSVASDPQGAMSCCSGGHEALPDGDPRRDMVSARPPPAAGLPAPEGRPVRVSMPTRRCR
jgi:predicted enzyme related to lactoylglutathione lyase